MRLITEAIEKAKNDNKQMEKTLTTERTHRIDNLDESGYYLSLEKEMVFKVSYPNGKIKEDLVSMRPDNTDPAKFTFNFERLLDAFLSRFYFFTSPQKEEIDGRHYLKINFWPRDNLPPPRENTDHVINKIQGIILIDENTNEIFQIQGSLKESIHVLLVFQMSQFDLSVDFRDFNKLRLLNTVILTTKYSYLSVGRWGILPRPKKIDRFQTHTLIHEYSSIKPR